MTQDSPTINATTAPNLSLHTHLQSAGLRPTRQRLALAELLFNRPCRHVTAEQLMDEAKAHGLQLSLATIYNNLNQFTAAGLLREIVIGPGRSCFDNDTSHHHHFYDTSTGIITDIPAEAIGISGIPAAPAGQEIERVEVIIHTRPYSKSSCG